jgi:hypothetical protein
MQGYKFYWYDDVEGYQFVCMMPERRKDLTRITDESIISLVRKVFGENADMGRIVVVPITSDIRSTKFFPDTFPNFN